MLGKAKKEVAANDFDRVMWQKGIKRAFNEFQVVKGLLPFP